MQFAEHMAVKMLQNGNIFLLLELGIFSLKLGE